MRPRRHAPHPVSYTHLTLPTSDLLYHRQRHVGEDCGRGTLLCRGIAQEQAAHEALGTRKALAQRLKGPTQRRGLIRKLPFAAIDMQHGMPLAHAAVRSEGCHLCRHAAHPAAAHYLVMKYHLL